MTTVPPLRRGGEGVAEHPIWRGLPDRARHGTWARYQDPVFGYISLAPLLRQALDLAQVQRLRGIKQLSGLDLVFPGATHTRFEHSVGVMWLAGEAHKVLEQKAPAHSTWPRLNIATRLAVMLAGLFHDLGHGPYSHTYEMFLEREPHAEDAAPHGEPKSKPTPPHMRQTKRTILEDEEIGGFLRQVSTRLRDQGEANAGLVDPEQIARLSINEPLTAAFKDYSFLGQIISGEFDVDRLDYLRRDSVHTGVPMGLDTSEILAAYTLAQVSINEPNYEEPVDRARERGLTGEPEGELGWTLKLDWVAAEAFEGMLVARDTAYRRLYYQRAHRSGQEMLILALQRLTRRVPEPPPPAAGPHLPPEALARKDDQELLEMFSTRAVDMKDSLLKVLYRAWKQRDLYEPLPYAIRIHDWPNEVRLRLEGQLRLQANDALRKAMRAAAERVEMRLENDDLASAGDVPPERILVDITKVPVSGADAYRGRWLWDDREGQLVRETIADQAGGEPKTVLRRCGYSLNELLPHMNALHGVLPDGRNAHRDYTAQMQTVLIFVPGSFMERLHEELIGGRRGADPADVARLVYGRRIAPIVDAFYEVLIKTLPTPPSKETLFADLEREMCTWLSSGTAFPTEGAREIWGPFP